MTSKPIVAIDIDDVLADTTDALRIWGNQRSDKQLTPQDFMIDAEYWAYYGEVWKRHELHHLKYEEFEDELIMSQKSIPLIPGAAMALKELQKEYHVVLITSRNPDLERSTREWLAPYIEGDIELYLARSIKRPEVTETKGEICARLGASILIDDSVEHVTSALEHGIEAILFGNYGWQSHVPKGAVRKESWSDVLEYLHGSK